MRFVYKPEGAEPKSWEFDPLKMMAVELEVIEDKTGLPFMEWVNALGSMSAKAVHGLLFVYLKREIPTLKWDDVQFTMGDIELELSEGEEEPDDDGEAGGADPN